MDVRRKRRKASAARRSLSSICASVSSSKVRTVCAVDGLIVAMATMTLDFSNNRIAEDPQAFDLEFDAIAALQERAALGAGAVANGARSEHFAGAQGLIHRDVRDHLLEGPVDRARIRVAPDLVVDAAGHAQIVDVGNL